MFTNPVVGGTTLVRPAIQSPNFVAGASGWSINADGSAEFNAVTIRGTLQSSNYVANVSGWQLNNNGTAFLNGTLTMGGSGIIKTASGTTRLEIAAFSSINQLTFWEANNVFLPAYIVAYQQLGSGIGFNIQTVGSDGFACEIRLNDNGHDNIQFYGSRFDFNDPIVCVSPVTAGEAKIGTWAVNHAAFQHYTGGNMAGGNPFGYLMRSDGLCWIGANTSLVTRINGTDRAVVQSSDPIASFKGTDRFGAGDCHRFWSDGEAWHWSVGIGGDNPNNAGLYCNDGFNAVIYNFDQIGDWTQSPLFTWSDGGGSGARITFRAAGQNAAPILKSWVGDFECRWSDDLSYTIIRAAAFNPSRAEFKQDIVRATDKLPKAERKSRIKKMRTIHHRWKERNHCANCLGTGLASENRRISDAMAQQERHSRNPNAAALPDEIATVQAPEPNAVCPDCNGDPAYAHAAWKKGQESGWFSFDVEEVAAIMPEVVGWKEYVQGEEVKPEAIDVMGLVALLWEEVKDLEDRLATVEGGKK